MQFIEFPIDKTYLSRLVAEVAGYGWVFEWGMFLFLLATIGVTAWVFIDSTQKRKADKSLLPRIMSLVGIFLVMPAFIFRYTGNADGVTLRVRLLGEPGQPFFDSPIQWNVNWLLAGYGPKIALLALFGVGVSVLAAIIYASTVNRQRPSTEFISALNNQFGDLRQEIQSVKSRQSGPVGAPTMSPGASAATVASDGRRSAATVIERPSSAATIIERPAGGLGSLRAVSGADAGKSWKLPAGEARIGRDAANMVAIQDAKSSREHARIRFADGVYSISDLGSANGTFVNDSRLDGQVPLTDGDLIKIGDSVLQFQASGN